MISPIASALQRAENSSIIEGKARKRKSASAASALQRAENSSIMEMLSEAEAQRRPSALQRAENSSIILRKLLPRSAQIASALQRAENSSIIVGCQAGNSPDFRECSSASRKFLNNRAVDRSGRNSSESALQRAENSSIIRVAARRVVRAVAKCSSASRKFLNNSRRAAAPLLRTKKVLFSEPKIPQ